MKRCARVLSLILAGSLLVAAFLTGCVPNNTTQGTQKPTTKPTTQTTTTPPVITKYNEAPMLAAQVTAGKLPALEDRLPETPKIANEFPNAMMATEIGEYGGVLRTCTDDIGWDPDLLLFQIEPLINTPGLLGEEFVANIVEKYEVNADSTVFSFTLRKGLKWSDGVPVTTKDVDFAWNDFILNTELTPSVPNWLRVGSVASGEPPVLKIVDDYTFTMTYPQSNGGFLLALAIQGWRNYDPLIKPRHYLEQFHVTYAKADELAKKISEANKETWVQLFKSKDTTAGAAQALVGMPVLTPWMMVEFTDDVIYYERNPYYFKIDQAGNQLPYIDKLESWRVQSADIMQIKIIAGEVDYANEITSLSNLQLYKENEKNGYKTYMNISANTPADICIMQPYLDLEWRKVALNVKFRQALAYSIDYQEIIDSIFLGFGEIPDELNACAEYNVAKANQLLDEIGLDKKDASGFRLRPDGVRMDMYIDNGGSFPEHMLVSELLVEYWQAIGLFTALNSINPDLMYERLEKQDIQVMLTIGSWPLWFQPWWNGSSLWARQFQFFYNTSGTTGEEGPQIITDYFKLLSSVNQVPAEKAVSEVIPAIKKMHRENLFTIVTVSDIPKPIIVNAKIGNYTEDCLSSAIQFTAEQWYYKK